MNPLQTSRCVQPDRKGQLAYVQRIIDEHAHFQRTGDMQEALGIAPTTESNFVDAFRQQPSNHKFKVPDTHLGAYIR